MRSFRSQKVSDLLIREVSKILQEEISDPRIGFVTVTGVEVTKDIRYAKVYVSVMGDESKKEESLKVLESARTYIQNRLGERVRLRFLPILKFFLDESLEYGSRIDALLDQINSEPKSMNGATES
jgi:ribosome-binding factor A